MFINSSRFSIYFGDQITSYKDDSLHGYSQSQIKQLPGYKEFCDQNACEKLIILEQVHGANGYKVLEEKDAFLKPYSFNGDYSLTTMPGIALAIETADCASVVLVDAVSGVVAIVHAGWRGSLNGVVSNAVRDLVACGSTIENIQAYFGPAARSCCYEVSQDFKAPYEQRNGAVFFDNTLYIISQLNSLGILKKNIITEFAFCTIHSKEYCSFRRQGDQSFRQMTIVALK